MKRMCRTAALPTSTTREMRGTMTKTKKETIASGAIAAESTMTSDGPIIAVFDDWGSVAKAFTKAGATVLQVDTNKQAKRALEVADAIALTGGGDVAPERYGALNRHKRVYGVNADRDQREFKAVKKAMMKGLPMFGICRGRQLLNVANGGSLTR